MINFIKFSIYVFSTIILFQIIVRAQGVAVNTSGDPADASAMLDVSSTTQGVLIPRMTETQRTDISSPANGLLVYQTNGTAGFYYNAGTSASPNWISLSSSSSVSGSTWSTTGNSGTTAGTNFIGTTDARDFAIKTNGSAAANERARIFLDGRITINSTTAQSGDLFAAYGSGYTGATNSNTNTNYPINGYSTGSFSSIYGENTGSGQGVLGSNTGTGIGVYGASNNVNGQGVFGNNQTTGIGVGGNSAGGYGINGITNGALTSGVRGLNQSPTGTGIIALGNNLTSASVNGNGSGLAANGTVAGIFSVGTNTITGVGIYGCGNGVTDPNNPGIGAGVIGEGTNYGVVGYVNSVGAQNNKWAGYFDYLGSTNSWAYVGGRFANTDYGIYSVGTKSTVVRDASGNNRVMFCPEAPEVLFEDYGTGTLVNGHARIDLDPVFSGTIYIDNNRPLKVFIQLEGECNGVYVTNKSVNGFDVYELSSGTSNVPFSWHVVANRADARDESGNVTSTFASLRFPIGVDKPKASEMRSDKAVTPQESKIPQLKNEQKPD